MPRTPTSTGTAPARAGTGRGDAGSSLVGVLGVMTVLTIVLLGTLTQALGALPAARTAQDGKAALAAAHAGVEDYLTRLNANGNYWQSPDSSNPAFSTAGTPIAGTGTDKGRFRYSVLDDVETITRTGQLRLEVTGSAVVPGGAPSRRRVTRTLRATLSPVGFLKYIYYTDLESLDPSLYSAEHSANVNGADGYQHNNDYYRYIAHPDAVEEICSRHYYSGRQAITYVATEARPVYAVYYRERAWDKVRTHTDGRVVTLGAAATPGCINLQWTTGDDVDGPLHTNDALWITGSPRFRSPATESSWADTDTPKPADPTRRWWGPGTPDAAGHRPTYFPAVDLPDSNGALLTAAQTHGCVYSGATRLTFTDTSVRVLSPNTTTANRSVCFNPSNRASEQTISPIPPVIYVSPSTGSCTGVGYPINGEAKLGATPDHACTRGNAYVSGRLQGRTTVGADNDVVITSNLTYQGGATGTDVLGLIGNNRVWVYHPVNGSGTNLLTSAQTPYTIHAAILSVRHSFLVQSWNYGAALNAGGQKLTVLGSISQKYRGPVGTTNGNGYLKNYVYDRRLLTIPPPYFLQPRTSPWVVQKLSG